jgi:hypothetical protein
MTQELIHDRIRKFLDIRDEDTIPNETTICKFRNKLNSLKMHISTHDSTRFDALTKDEDKTIFVDSGYICRERSEEMPLGCKISLRTKGVFA